MAKHDGREGSEAQPGEPRRHFSEAAQLAAQAAKAAKRAETDMSFGTPELFIVAADDRRFTWELRRFGGIVLQRGDEAFPDPTSARAAGEAALAVLLAEPGLPTFARQAVPR